MLARLQLACALAPLFFLAAIFSPRAQEVMLADLEGAIIEARFLRHQTLIREGHEVSNQLQTDLKIEIGPADKIRQTLSPTVHTVRGIRKGKPTSGEWTLERARETVTRGGGHTVWFFSDGALTFLRTFQGGALKRVFTFTSGPGGLSCTGTENFVREQGVRGIHLNSGFDDVPVIILTARPISATCRVKTPKTLGLDVPPMLLAWADEMIEQ
jgi:hypothetical protein